MSKGLLEETLELLAPVQEAVPTWEDILTRAGIENAVPTRRPLWKRSWVIALAMLVVVLVPLAAIGSEQGWLFLDHGKVMPGMPKPLSEIVEVKRGSWSGHDWRLAAYRALVRRHGVGVGVDGLCYLVQTGDGTTGGGDEGVCAPIPPQLPGVSSGSSALNSISFFGGSFDASQGATDKTGYVFGMVADSVTEVDIHFRDGRAIDTPTFAAPEGLGAPVRFFGVELPEYGLYPSISRLIGLDGQGKIVACTVNPSDSSLPTESCS
ncbi:MAG: hypothetical protein ABSC51_00440 [Gaiellaceae bacterium]|jgi:hypothetical protein